MSPTRRVFLKTMGVALASLVMARCAPFPDEKDRARSRLRDCWLRLDWLAEQTQQGYDKGEQAKKELTQQHRVALDSLVASGALDKQVAYYIEYAFAAAADYVFGSNTGYLVTGAGDASNPNIVVTCYLPVEVTVIVPDEALTPTPAPAVKEAAERQVGAYQSSSAERLLQQADFLAAIAEPSRIDAATVARARQAIQRDLFLLSSTTEERRALADRLVEMAGGTYNLPPFEQWDPALPPDVVEAARFLVELLLEK